MLSCLTSAVNSSRFLLAADRTKHIELKKKDNFYLLPRERLIECCSTTCDVSSSSHAEPFRVASHYLRGFKVIQQNNLSCLVLPNNRRSISIIIFFSMIFSRAKKTI